MVDAGKIITNGDLKKKIENKPNILTETTYKNSA